MTGCLRNGGARGTWPGQRRSSGLRLVSVVGWALVAAVAASAQVQYRDRNGQTWSAPNQIDRQRREDNQARSNFNSGYVRVGPSLEQELAAYWSQHRAWEEGARRMHEANQAFLEEEKLENARKAQAAALREGARREAKLKEEREAHLAKQRGIVAEILQKADEGAGVLKGSTWSPWLVAALAEGLITGKFHGLSLEELKITGSTRDRFGRAQRLFREADGFEGRAQNRSHEGSAGAYGFDFISRAASVLRGSRTFVDSETNHWNWSRDIFSESERILVHLCMTLAMPESRLNPEQREQAARLVADAMGRVSLEGDDGAAFACIVVTAARRSPELCRIPMLHEKVIPVARKSIWAYGIESWPAPDKEAVPLVVNPTTGLYWNLAAMLCLGSDRETPLQWFAMLRDERRAGLAPATATELARVQQGLEGWFARCRFSATVRQAIQADCDLACRASEGELASATTWDATLRPFRGKLPSEEERAAVCAALSNPASLRQAGARSTFAISRLKSSPRTDAAIDGLVYTYLGKACAEGPDLATRVLTALRWMTEIEDAVSFREMPRAKWEALVKLGEGFCAARDPQWTDPSVGARLARLRSERLGDEAGAQQWLAAPGRQPGDGDTPEKWREWATLAGRPGIRIAAQRHPEHFTEPALLRRALEAVAGNGSGALSPAERLTAKALLAHAGELTDRETVLAVAKVRGFGLGDWAKLGAWLDEPRRRPKGSDDPLYEVFVAALMERDQAEGYLSEDFFEGQGLGPNLQQFERWLRAVLAAKGEPRKKLIDDYFPAVIYGPDTDSPYPDLRLLGYDIGRGGWGSRALLLLSSAEFDPSEKIIQGYVTVDGDNGKPERVGGYDVEPWLAAVAKLPREVKPEALLAEIADTMKTLRAVPATPVEATPALPETKPRELSEEEDGLRRAKVYREMIEDRRTRFVGVACQDALARLASRWSPVRAPAQAALLTLGDHLFLDDEGQTKVNVPGLAARIKWEQAKMRGLDNTAAFAAVRATLREEDVRTLAKLAKVKGSLLLERDSHFDREVGAAAAAVVSR